MFLNVTSALLSTPNKSYSWCFCEYSAASCKGSKCNGRSENSEGIKVVGWGIGVKIELHPFEE